METINGTIKYSDFEKQLNYPENFDQLKDKIMELFTIPIEKKSSLIKKKI